MVGESLPLRFNSTTLPVIALPDNGLAFAIPELKWPCSPICAKFETLCMARIYKREKVWNLDFSVSGRRIRRKVGTSKKVAHLVLQDAVVTAERREFRFTESRQHSVSNYPVRVSPSPLLSVRKYINHLHPRLNETAGFPWPRYRCLVRYSTLPSQSISRILISGDIRNSLPDQDHDRTRPRRRQNSDSRCPD